MIQRIQTIWLSICIILSLLLVKGDIVEFTSLKSGSLSLTFSGLIRITDQGNELLRNSTIMPAVLIILPVASLSAVLLFRKRRLQKIAVAVVIALAFIFCGCEVYYWRIAASVFNASIIPGIKMTFSLVIIILAMMAWAGIRRDEKIVKSYDRLR